jgi:hypothetical protein
MKSYADTFFQSFWHMGPSRGQLPPGNSTPLPGLYPHSQQRTINFAGF